MKYLELNIFLDEFKIKQLDDFRIAFDSDNVISPHTRLKWGKVRWIMSGV